VGVIGLERLDLRSGFINDFYQENLEREDFLCFGQHVMQIDPSDDLLVEIMEEVRKKTSEPLQQLYYAAQALEGRVSPKGVDARGRCERNFEKLFALAFPASKESFFKEEIEPELKDLGDPEEAIELEKLAFSERKIEELKNTLKAIPKSFSVPVRDPENLTLEDLKEIAAGEASGALVMPWQTTSKDPSYSSYLLEKGDLLALHQIPHQETSEILTKILTQLSLDFSRQYHVAILTGRGLKRIYVEHKIDADLEKVAQISERDTEKAVSDLLIYVKSLAYLKARKQLLVLDYSSQTLFNQVSALFYQHYLPKIQEFLSQFRPEDTFIPILEDLSEIIHDVRFEQTSCTQFVAIDDCDLAEERKKCLPVLRFKIEAIFDWESEKMILESVELLYEDAKFLRQS
jgi:hypothetical protein